MQDQPADKPLSGQELIIVAVILAILSAILLPQFSRADAVRCDMPAVLSVLRGRLGAYRRTHDNQLPALFYCGGTTIDGDRVWAELNEGRALVNPLNGLSSILLVDSGAFDSFEQQANQHSPHGIRKLAVKAGWIANTSSGRIWATAADAAMVFDEHKPLASGNNVVSR